jgi:hypothetical protein
LFYRIAVKRKPLEIALFSDGTKPLRRGGRRGRDSALFPPGKYGGQKTLSLFSKMVYN